MFNLKKYRNFIVGILFLSILFFCGCSFKQSENQENVESGLEIQASQKIESTENISITTSDKYTITLDKEFYRPSMRIAKNKDEYVSVQQLKNGNEKLNISDPKAYTNEKLKSDFQEYLSKLTGFSPVTEVQFGNKEMCKTTTSVNAIKSDIYRFLSESKNVYKIIVSGAEFKDSDEAEKIMESLVLQ